jgi:hypothetical protein
MHAREDPLERHSQPNLNSDDVEEIGSASPMHRPRCSQRLSCTTHAGYEGTADFCSNGELNRMMGNVFKSDCPLRKAVTSTPYLFNASGGRRSAYNGHMKSTVLGYRQFRDCEVEPGRQPIRSAQAASTPAQSFALTSLLSLCRPCDRCRYFAPLLGAGLTA